MSWLHYFDDNEKKGQKIHGTNGNINTYIKNTSPIEVAASIAIDPDSFGSAPVVGQHTVTSVASELFANGTPKANRTRMEITNLGDIDIYVGPAGVTADNGYPIFPLESREFKFSADTAVSIYAISPGKAIVCRVMEV